MTRPKRPLGTFTHRGAWPESEKFPHAIITTKLGDLAAAVIDEIRPAFQDYRANEKLRAEIGSRAEQINAARELADICMQAAQALRNVDIDHIEADAWLHAHREGVDLGDTKAETAQRLIRIASYYRAAADKSGTPVMTKPGTAARDALAQTVVRAASPHCKRAADLELIVHDVLQAAGATCPADLPRYLRRLRK